MSKYTLEDAAQPAPECTRTVPDQTLVLRAFQALLDSMPQSKFMIGGEMSNETVYRVHIEEMGEYYIIYPNDSISEIMCTEVHLPDHDPNVLAECMTEHWDEVEDLKKRDLVKMFKALRDKKVKLL